MHYKPVIDSHNSSSNVPWDDTWGGREQNRLGAAVQLLMGDESWHAIAEHHRDHPDWQSSQPRQTEADTDPYQLPFFSARFESALYNYYLWSKDAEESLANLIDAWDDLAKSVEKSMVQAACWATASGEKVVHERMMEGNCPPVWFGMGSPNGGASWTTDLVGIMEEWDEVKSRLREIWTRVQRSHHLARALQLADRSAEDTSP